MNDKMKRHLQAQDSVGSLRCADNGERVMLPAEEVSAVKQSGSRDLAWTWMWGCGDVVVPAAGLGFHECRASRLR